MNAPLPLHSSAILNRAFVAAGVARFAAHTLQRRSPLVERLLAEAGALHQLLGCAADDWAGACRTLARMAPSLGGPWGRLLHDHQLQLHEWYALALAGECEASHVLGLVVAELQAPAAGARPTLHLLAALAAQLFDAELAPLAWPQHALVRHGLARLLPADASPVAGEPGEAADLGAAPLPQARLQVPARLWAVLCGNRQPWAELQRLAADPAVTLPAAWSSHLQALLPAMRCGRLHVLVLRAARHNGQAAAAQLAAELGLLPVGTRLADWQASSALAAACRYAGWLPVLDSGLGPGDSCRPALPAVGATPLVLLAGRDGSVDLPDCAEIDLPPLDRDERRRGWQRAWPHDQAADQLADAALVDGPTIAALAARMTLQAELPGDHLLQCLRRARMQHGAERLAQLAQPVLREVPAAALVLPPQTQAQFDQLVRRCRRREGLWAGLGPGLAGSTSTGVRALFAGDSGAGKTLAASRLASVTGAPLYRVDLAAVMNKYVGETEKNLGRLLDEAAALDAMLLVDEADALFGRRSGEGAGGAGREGSGERYADMMTNYLLTRIEAHPGLVVLTTNTRSRLDSAFTRRFDVIIDFPLPGVDERQRLWRAHLGERSPGDEACRLLAGYSDLPGGHIRNAVVHAAAQGDTPADEPLDLSLLVAALLDEYRKLGRTPPAQLHQIVG